MAATHDNYDPDERTSIRVTKGLADDLHDLKNRGDSYADVIRRLIDEHEGGNGEK